MSEFDDIKEELSDMKAELQDDLADVKEEFIDVGEAFKDVGVQMAGSFAQAFGFRKSASRKPARRIRHDQNVDSGSEKSAFRQLKCPSCGAFLDRVDVLNPGKCSFCGQTIILDNDARMEAELEIKELENEKYMFEKRHERRMLRQKQYPKNLLFAFGGLVLMMLIPLSILGIGSYSDHKKIEKLEAIEAQAEEYYLSGNYDAALLKANQLVYDGTRSDSEGEKWDERREKLIEIIEKAMEKNAE